MSGISGPSIINSGLVLALDAANRTSYVSGSKNSFSLTSTSVTGSLKNGLGFSYNNLGTFVYDGTNDYMSFGNLTMPTTALSVFAWVYHTDTNGNHQDFVTKVGTFKFRIDSNAEGGNLSAFAVIGGGYEPRLSTSWTKNTWIQAAFTWNTNGNFRLFKNGILANSSTTRTGTLSTATNALEVGSDTSSTYYWKGNISNVLIYNQTLTDSQVLQNYNATKARFGL